MVNVNVIQDGVAAYVMDVGMIIMDLIALLVQIADLMELVIRV